MTHIDGLDDPAESRRFEEACDWFLRLRESQESTELVAEWLAWCRADARNPIAFEEVRALWWQTRKVRPLAGAPAAPATMAVSTARPARQRSRGWMLAAAAVLAVLATGSIVRVVIERAGDSAAATVFSTAQREHRSFQLADGSRVELAGDSRLRVRLEPHRRQLELEQGEAYFNVAHDASRPFVVTAGATHVTAVGTSFNVRSGNDLVVVAVEEGVVVVEPAAGEASSAFSLPLQSSAAAVPAQSPIRLRRGQEVSVGVTNHELQLTSIEPAAVASWREGRLRFARESLRSVVTSVLAASGQQIELADPALGDLKFTGTVFSSRVSDWVEGLPSIYPVTVRREGEKFVVEPRE